MTGKTNFVGNISYKEWDNLNEDRKNGIIQSDGHLNDTDGYSTIKKVYSIDATDNDTVMKTLSTFAEKIRYEENEHSMVITTDGRVFEVEGTGGVVNTELVGKDNLKRATVIHNHPIWEGWDLADSFSKDDLTFAAKYSTGKNYLVSGTFTHSFYFVNDFSEEEINLLYDATKKIIGNRTIDTLDLTFVQLEHMRELNKLNKGVVFNENEKL